VRRTHPNVSERRACHVLGVARPAYQAA